MEKLNKNTRTCTQLSVWDRVSTQCVLLSYVLGDGEEYSVQVHKYLLSSLRTSLQEMVTGLLAPSIRPGRCVVRSSRGPPRGPAQPRAHVTGLGPLDSPGRSQLTGPHAG